jgi:hypothetical protein
MPSSVIAFLLINNLDALPTMAIQSALNATDAPLAIGYINEADLPEVAINPRISLIKLELSADLSAVPGVGNSEYLSFSSNDFFKLVQMKWVLFDKLFEQGFDYVFYSDSDVVWLGNPIPELIQRFDSNSSLNIQIQSFTLTPSDPKLCMGFVAMRNSSFTKTFIQDCKTKHSTLLANSPRTGDDDVVTALYLEMGMPSFLLELPQSTFPVGNMLNLYSRKMAFPGLSSPVPFLFHANFVVGLKNKLRLIQLFANTKVGERLNIPFGMKTRIYLSILRFKIWVRFSRFFS